MQKVESYKGSSLDARSHELREGKGYSAEVYIAQLLNGETIDTQFTLHGTFPSNEAALDAALKLGRQKVDSGFEPKLTAPDTTV